MLEFSDTYNINSVYPQSYGSFDMAELLSLWFVLLPHCVPTCTQRLFHSLPGTIRWDFSERGGNQAQGTGDLGPGRSQTHLPARGTVSPSLGWQAFWTRACVCVVVIWLLSVLPAQEASLEKEKNLRTHWIRNGA